MKKALVISILACLFYLQIFANKYNPLVAHSKQLLVVTTSSWNTNQGTLQRYERKDDKHGWQAVGSPIKVVVGKQGLAWNSIQQYSQTEPVKKEGDNRTPAGAFPLGPSFGFAPGYIKNIKMPYTQLVNNTVCVTDPNSKFYNQIVNEAKINSSEWDSVEPMRQNPQYLWGIAIAYNTKKPVPGLGSCSFIHIWKDANQGTTNSVAMAEPNVEQLITWLNATKKPTLVILPNNEYKRLEKTWGLPASA